MNDRLIRDNPVSDEQIQAWADEAERGYDLTKLPSPPPPPPPPPPPSRAVSATGRVTSRWQHPSPKRRSASSEGEWQSS